MKARDDQRMAKLEFYFESALFGHMLKKISTFIFSAWSFLLVHIQFTPSEGPKDFVN